MRGLVKKIHMYAGLLSFTAFVVYGVTGLYTTFRPAPGPMTTSTASTREVAFPVPGGLTDKQIADRVFDALDLPLTRRLRAGAIRRDQQQNLLLNFHTVNGRRTVTVLEDEGRLRILEERASLGQFANGMHATVLQHAPPRFLTRAWAWYNEIAIWSLLLMVVSGVYLWLASRPSHRVAQLALGAGTGVFLWLYWLTR